MKVEDLRIGREYETKVGIGWAVVRLIDIDRGPPVICEVALTIGTTRKILKRSPAKLRRYSARVKTY